MLRFKNLNALQGEWQINFDDIGYQTDSFFSIIGPTGSGKSTILDAICLSLYGKTPRLDKITQSENLIMSQNTSECFAELIFKTTEGVFCTHWSHMRAHLKRHGKLQAPKHELSDWHTKKPITTKKNEVAQNIIALIGLDFLQFTRAILLAQGQFSAFLNANPTDKGALLEKITGLDVYSELSKQSFENNKLIEANLAEKWRSLEHISLLSTTDLNSLEDRINVLNEDNNEIKIRINKLHESRNNIIEIQDSKNRLQKIEAQQQIQITQQILFEADARRLNDAKNAFSLEVDYQGWQICHQNLQDTQDKLIKLNHEIESLEKKRHTSLISQTHMAGRLLEHAKEKKYLYDLLKEVRGMDLMIENLEQQLLPLMINMQNVIDDNKQLSISEVNLTQKIDVLRLEHQKHQEYLKNHIVLKSLHSELSGLKASMENQKNNKIKYHQYKIEKQKIDVEYANSQQQVLKSAVILSELDTAYQKNLQLYDKAVINADADSFVLEDLLSQQKIVTLQREHCEHIVLLHKNINNDRVTFQAKQVELYECELCINQLSLCIHTLTLDLDSAQNTLQLLIENDRLSQKIKALEDERKLLRMGEPCPLCGSLTHPYIDSNDYIQSIEYKNNASLMQCQNKVNQLVLQLAQNQADLKMYQNRTIELSQNNVQFYEKLCIELVKLKALCAEYNEQKFHIAFDNINFIPIELTHITLDTLDQLNLTNIMDCQSLCDVILFKIGNNISKYQSNLEKINRYSIDCSHTRKILDDYKIIHQNYVNLENTLMVTIQNLLNNILEIYSEMITKSRQLHSAMLPFLQAITFQYNEVYKENSDIVKYISMLEDVFIKIEKADSLYQQATEKEFVLEKQMVSLSGDLANIRILAKEKQRYIISVEQNVVNIKDRLSEFVTKRSDLFGDKSCDEEAQRFELEALNLKTLSQGIDNELVTVTTQLEGLQRQFEQSSMDLVSQSDALEKAQQQLNMRMQSYGFCDLIAFQNARLSQLDYDQLLSKSEALSQEHHALMVQYSTIKSRLFDLEYERTDKIQSLSFLNEVGDNHEDWLKCENEILLNKTTDLMTTLTNLLESNQNLIGRLESQCNQQYEYIKKYQTIIDEIKDLEATSQPIRLLNEWIGAADGKKYRNFAQSLSFEHMLRLGNQYLQIIDPRYEMTTHIDSPFEVMVRDTYQANHIRSSRTLSGGESFIISLALALGLSRMASKNVLIETLFLDEGFGALDEGALDSVLAALNNLQQAGKMIGVISHVESMKERFANQIKVIPISNGLSMIEGVGVKRCALL